MVNNKKGQEASKVYQPAETPAKKRKLSFKDQQELDALPNLIETLENQQAQLTKQISAVSFYKQDPMAIGKTLAEMEKTEADLAKAYQRWDELEALGE